MPTKHKKYTNNEITILWKPELCIHSANCVKGLPAVFKPKERPWIQIENADCAALMKTVETCPSGALSYIKNAGENVEPANKMQVEVLANGPLIISGGVVIKQGEKETIIEKRASLCRCGASENKPFCDGSHKRIGFAG